MFASWHAIWSGISISVENVSLPLYHHRGERWISMTGRAIFKVTGYFNTQRMMRRDAAEAYLR
jgi:hypothetical protein